MNLWGYDLQKRQLEGFTADTRQVADIRLLTLDDGLERGVRIAHVRTGSGLDFDVLLDRALDIGTATYNGIPLAWQSGTGAAHPSRFEPEGLGWLRTFHGGLLALCGMTHAGVLNNSDHDPANGEPLGLHGRVGTIPAYDVRVERSWTDDGQPWQLSLKGTVDEVVLFGYRLRLERHLQFNVGEAAFQITDTVRNIGGVPSPLMVLYHCNFGFPVVSPDSIIESPSTVVNPRDTEAEKGVDSWHQLHDPTPGYAEQVFFHVLDDPKPNEVAKITNQKLGLSVAVEFDSRTLGYLTEWKQMGYGDYVVGIEPGNCYPEGRVQARETGRLEVLEPGESQMFNIGFRVEMG